MRTSHILLTILLPPLLLSQGCLSFFGSGRARTPAGPPTLEVRFDGAEAAASLTWDRYSGRNFLRYEIQRSEGGPFLPVALVETVDDTLLTDEHLRANQVYRYRVACYFGEKDGENSLLSTAVAGSIHRYVDAWSTGSDEEAFRPVRLVVDRRGTLFAVGVGSGRIARFDRAGNPLGDLEFTSEPLASLETGTLDGPSLALDDDDNLYVIYNVRRASGGPQASWSKFDPEGKRLWDRPLDGLFARHIVIDGDQIFIESISQLQQFDLDGQRQRQYLVPALLVSSLRFWSGRFAALIEPLHLVAGDWEAPRLVVYESVERQSTGLVIGRDPTSDQDRGSGLLRRPTDFVVDEEFARSFVVNAGLDRIEVFRQERFLTSWGQQGDGPGQFRFSGRAEVIDDVELGSVVERQVVAGGIARDAQGYLYIADTFNDRIQKFQP